MERQVRDDFPAILRAAREQRGLTQHQLAARSHLTVTHISRLERGKATPRRLTLEALSRALDVELESFQVELEPAAGDAECTEEEFTAEISRVARQFPPEMRKTLLEAAYGLLQIAQTSARDAREPQSEALAAPQGGR